MDTHGDIANDVHDIRYSKKKPGKITYMFRGRRIYMKAPRDILLVESPRHASAMWIAEHYGLLLCCLPKTPTRLRE